MSKDLAMAIINMLERNIPPEKRNKEVMQSLWDVVAEETPNASQNQSLEKSGEE